LVGGDDDGYLQCRPWVSWEVVNGRRQEIKTDG